MNLFHLFNTLIQKFYDNPFLMGEYDEHYLYTRTRLYQSTYGEFFYSPLTSLKVYKKDTSHVIYFSKEDQQSGRKFDDLTTEELNARRIKSDITMELSKDNDAISISYSRFLDLFYIKYRYVKEKEPNIFIEGSICRPRRNNGSHIYSEDEILLEILEYGRSFKDTFKKIGDECGRIQLI